jgi:hypothetical protein
MKKRNGWVVVLLLVVAVAASVVRVVVAAPRQIDGLAAVAAADAGNTWAAVYEDSKIRFYLMDKNGVRQDSFSVPRKSGESIAQIAHMTADAQGSLYFLKNYSDTVDGAFIERQELTVYTPGLLPFGRTKTIRLDSEDDAEAIRYLHIHVSTSVVLTGVNADGGKLARKAYDLESLKDEGGMTVKALRTYPADTAEGVYKAVAVGTDAAYIAKTGRVFFSAEGALSPVRIFPDAGAQLSSYASFICASAPGQVIVGEQKSGNVLRLYTQDGKVEYILEGSRSLGTLTYTGKDILEMAFSPTDEASWVAVAGSRTGASELIVSDQGDITLITKIGSGIATTILAVLGNAALYSLLFLAVFAVAYGVYSIVTRSWLVVVKLIVVSIPVLILALTLFGIYSYSTYWSSLRSTYETKASDQGNLLRALFSSASFDKITAPELYGSVEYDYLYAQMGTRDIYTSSAYFVDGKLYTGVDANLPCLYPFDVRHSADARALYRAAAMSGAQQSGVITDRLGERIVCVTPVGSSSGNTVFLLETGIFQAEIDKQTGGFLRNYLIISICCLISACALLLIAFLRILKPLGGIIEGLDQFSQGNRTVRLESATNDELSDIARVFNKMAKDIDVQIYNLKMMGDTYYRFVPEQVFHLLGKENLADVQLGNAVEGKYCVLVANLYPRQGRMDFEGMQELTNNFFAIIHKASGEHGATLLSDSAGLRDLRLICPDGDAAVGAAMEAIARIDEYNAKCSIAQRLDVSFFLHYTRMGFGICGDGERYVPALISAELDDTLARCEDFRRLSSRLIVTGAAYAVLDAGKYFHRFIGFATDDEEQENGLYDFYDSGSPTAIRLLNETLSAFDKAMMLYLQKRYYDAKNMFAIVLRENQYDNVARHYVFQCEKKL